jgi:hypothetical protein
MRTWRRISGTTAAVSTKIVKGSLRSRGCEKDEVINDVLLHSGNNLLIIACLAASLPSSNFPRNCNPTIFVKNATNPRIIPIWASGTLSATTVPTAPDPLWAISNAEIV